jgi:preprotein translocase subunit SecF
VARAALADGPAEHLIMRRLFSNTTIDFIGVRKFAYGLTAAFFLPGLVLLLVRGLNYSVEFTGGTLMRIRLEPGVTTDIGAIRKGLGDAGLHGAEIQQYGGGGEFAIRARTAVAGTDADNTAATGDALKGALNAVIGEGKYQVSHLEGVGAKVGGELRQKALLAIFLSSFAILAYLAIRFEWRFGLAAIGATLHDVLGTIMFISLFKLEVSLVVVGAVLSVLGLSLNETIIIFDRVRENEKKRLPLDLAGVLNLSINETLPRTVLTHGTSLATMLTLAIFAGEVIRPFALVMFFGVFSGIFSSMYIAPSVLMFIRHRWPQDPTHSKGRVAAPKVATATR